jgi:hypothetical protein
MTAEKDMMSAPEITEVSHEKKLEAAPKPGAMAENH